ncbi:serine/threonine-protein kinase, partial [Enhygromyxa salina]|uniref:serine/threonine-protein kinase n=1 Tax=Enhygromyxa salina TaxID=215803 RepID=UPI0006969234
MDNEDNGESEFNALKVEAESGDVLGAGELVAYRYRVVQIGRNHPLGELYRCHDETEDRRVLLQRLRREFSSPSVRDRLFETRGSAALEVAAITDILDYGEDLDGRPFLVTAWSDDVSLAEVERPLSFREAIAIALRVAAALEPVHRKRLAHGGIEPHSILVDDARELTGLLDFGLVPALEAGADKLRALPLLTSPAYAAPELIRGEPIGPATDVYALGILVWELILGSAPFRGPTLRVLDSHLNRALPAFELPFDAPASFEWVLRRMLAKQIGERFADAGEVAAQLRVYASQDYAVAMVDVHDVHDDPEDEATVAFEREPQIEEIEEDSWLVLSAGARAATENPVALVFDPAAHRRTRRRVAALAMLGCAALLLSWWGLGPRSEAVAVPVTASITAADGADTSAPAVVAGAARI